MFAICELGETMTIKDAEIQAIQMEKDNQIAELETRHSALEELVKQAAADGNGGVR